MRNSKKGVCLEKSPPGLGDSKSRAVVEVSCYLYKEIGGIGFVERPMGIYELTNAIIEEALKHKEKIKTLIKRLKNNVNHVRFVSSLLSETRINNRKKELEHNTWKAQQQNGLIKLREKLNAD